MNLKFSKITNLKETVLNSINKIFLNFFKYTKLNIDKTLETPYNEIGNIFNNLIIEEKEEYSKLKTNEEKIIFFENLFDKIDNTIKDSGYNLLFVRQPNISIEQFNNFNIQDKIYNLLGKKSEINQYITGGNCHFWNLFYIDLIKYISNNDKIVNLKIYSENDFHSFIKIGLGKYNSIIDPTGRDKTLKKLELKNYENYKDKSHFIQNIGNNLKNIKTIQNKYDFKNLNSYINKGLTSNIVSFGIRLNKINYQLIIDNKNNTEYVDIVFLKNGEKQKKTLPLNKIKFDNNKSIKQIFSFLTKGFIFEDNDIEILTKLIKKSSKEKLLKVLSLPKKSKDN